MNRTRVLALGLGVTTALLAASATASAAPAAPRGPHPRIWLTPATMTAMKSHMADPNSAASRVVTECEHILLPEKASSFAQAGVQGYNWAYSSATCALAWKLTGNAKYATPAVTLFRAMLDDYATLGDGAGGDAVVRHDTGYAIRFFGAYSGLLYDWLHDAPGVDDAVLAKARGRFQAWVDWYDTQGYLTHTAGSNMEAGYVYAKTLIAIAEAGEAGSVGDAYWTDVVDNIYPKDIIAQGLAPKGPLTGGDWPEGWQYGPQSVLSYALGARALEEQGVTYPALRPWADAMVVRFAQALNPGKTGQYPGGDMEDTGVDLSLNPRTLIAAVAGQASDEAAAWAMQMKGTIATAKDQCPVYDALAEARAVAPVDYHAAPRPTAYLASGTRNFFVRTSWDPAATQAVFTSAPRLVADHQHFDASNFVLSRGADHLIVDPSPYGSRSSLTGNALTVDSNVVSKSYAPSQSWTSKAEMPFARATEDGVAAARSELSGAFSVDSTPSDVAFARRDWTFLPEGEVVAIDRVNTGDAARGGYLRFRTTAALALSGNVARGTVGGSQVAIHGVSISSGTPQVQEVAVGDCWDSSAYGKCTHGRFPANEYNLRLEGPQAHAVHVIDALGAGEAPADVAPVDDPAMLGGSITRGGKRSFVLSSSAETAQSLTTMTYTVAGDQAARHVVFDAPEDASGASSVTAKANGAKCVVSITPGGANAIAGRPLVFQVTAASQGCQVTAATSAPTTGGGAPGTTADPGAGGQPTDPSDPGASGAGSSGSSHTGDVPTGGGVTPAGETHGASPAAFSPDAQTGGCSVGHGSSDGELAATLLSALVLAAGMRRRRTAA